MSSAGALVDVSTDVPVVPFDRMGEAWRLNERVRSGELFDTDVSR